MSLLNLVTTSRPRRSLAVGETVAQYVVERVLGEGSMGTVYLARHQRLGRHVALKVLHADLLGDAGLVQRFMREGRVVNQINHEHIVEVHDFIEETNPRRVCCVMEHLRGETLSQRLATRAFDVDEVKSIGRQICSALGAAHAAGVVHRDLKPENVFLIARDGRDDWVKVLDFGIAKSAPDGDLNLVQSQQGSLLGTPRYMAPEQVAGLEVDARTDVYALGTMLYELIAGRPPFDASSFGQLAADIITRPPPPLPRTTPSGQPVPPALAAAVMACLAKKPEQRPGSMGALDAALLSEHTSRRPVILGALAAVVVVSAVGFVLTRPQPTPAVVPPVVVAPTVVTPPAVTPVPVVPVAPETIVVTVMSTPVGASVMRLDSRVVLGKTPLELKVPVEEKPVRLRFSLDGYRVLEREVVLDQTQRLEVAMQALPKAAASERPVTDGVLDPY